MRCGKYREGMILNESSMKMAVFMEDRKIQLTEWEGPTAVFPQSVSLWKRCR